MNHMRYVLPIGCRLSYYLPKKASFTRVIFLLFMCSTAFLCRVDSKRRFLSENPAVEQAHASKFLMPLIRPDRRCLRIIKASMKTAIQFADHDRPHLGCSNSDHKTDDVQSLRLLPASSLCLSDGDQYFLACKTHATIELRNFDHNIDDVNSRARSGVPSARWLLIFRYFPHRYSEPYT